MQWLFWEGALVLYYQSTQLSGLKAFVTVAVGNIDVLDS